MTNSLVGFGMMLLRPIDWLIWLFMRRFVAKSPREKLEVDLPPSLGYGAVYAKACLMAVICLAYSSMFPLILVCVLGLGRNSDREILTAFVQIRYPILFLSLPFFPLQRRVGVGAVLRRLWAAIPVRPPLTCTLSSSLALPDSPSPQSSSVSISIRLKPCQVALSATEHLQLTMFGVLSLSRFWAAPGLLLAPLATYLYNYYVMDQYKRAALVGSLNSLRGNSAIAQEVQPGVARAAKFKVPGTWPSARRVPDVCLRVSSASTTALLSPSPSRAGPVRSGSESLFCRV